MNFNFGDILSRAWQITWKNKVLWAVMVLPFLVSLLMLPVWFILAFTGDLGPERIFRFMENQNSMAWIMVFYVFVLGISILLQVVSRASATLGVYRAQVDHASMTFMDLLRDGLPYFWRIFGVSFLIVAGIFILFLAFMAIAAVASVVTAGLAMLCIQPLFLLMIPLVLLGMAFLEQAESAVIADGMSVMGAARQALELIKTHVWKYVLITIILYFATNLLTSFVLFPLMLPMFFLMINSMEKGLDFSNMIKMQAVFAVVALPLMALVQGLALTYMKSAMMVTYLRLTRSSSAPQPLFQEATA